LEATYKSVKPDSTKAVSIKWKNPDKDYKSIYLVIVQDAFNKAYLALLETKETSISFYPIKMTINICSTP
jgi:hypothetical protein